jgi:hypothetical protein
MIKKAMRQFIRHPSDIPIRYTIADQPSAEANLLTNISEGGLAFHNPEPVAVGTLIDIDIPLIEHQQHTHGKVVWCQKCNGDYLIGVQFSDANIAFQARMVEQICHIEHYRRAILKNEGRALTSEEAAKEWIAAFADSFPDYDN